MTAAITVAATLLISAVFGERVLGCLGAALGLVSLAAELGERGIAAVVSGAPRVRNVHVRERPVPHVVVEPDRSSDSENPLRPRQDNYDPLKYVPRE